MSKPRAVHTVKSLMARTEEYGECRVWTGYKTNRTPQVEHDGRMMSVRKLIVQLQGTQITGKFFGAKCGTDLCVCPEHITQRTTKSHAVKMAKAAAIRQAEKATGQIVARRKRQDAKLDIEKAREIRASDESGPVLAKRYGVSRTLINRVKSGTYWRDSANPFSGLMG